MKMTKRLTRIAAVGATTLALAGASLALATGAQAATQLGTLTFNPASGIADQNISMTTHSTGAQKGCPAGDAQALSAIVTGPGNWAAGIPVVGFNTASLSTSSEMTVPWEDVFSSLAAVNAAPLQVGRYDVSLYCVNAAGSDYSGQFTGSIWFTSTTNWQSTDPSAKTATTTAISASATNVTQGTSVTLTATVAPAAATGTVQFLDNGTSLGTGTLAAGTASVTTAALAVGAHANITAVYSGDATFAGSTGTAPAITVTAPVATATTTALAITAPANATTADSVTLSATVSPSGAAGSVAFVSGSTTLASKAVVGGVATYTGPLPAGTWSIVANFNSSDTAAFTNSSSSPAQDLTVAAAATAGSQPIVTTVLPGALTLTCATSEVDLGNPKLNSTATLLVTDPKAMNTVFVTDTRPGQIPWSASGIATDFSDGGTHAINAGNLGWNNIVVTTGSVATVVKAGDPVPAGSGLEPGAPAPAGVGLGTARTLASSIPGGSVGNAAIDAQLVLQAPTTTFVQQGSAGTKYAATLTLTVA